MRVKHWNGHAKKAFRIFSYLTSIIGLWPPSEDTIFLKFQIGAVAIHVSVAVLTSAGKLIINCGDANDAIDSVLMLAVGVIALSKIVFLYLQRDNLVIIMNSSFADWTRSFDGGEAAIMQDNARQCNLLAKVYYSVGMLSTMLYVSNQVLLGFSLPAGSNNSLITESVPQIFIIPGSCVFNGIDGFLYYFVVVDQLFQLILASVTNIGTDTMYVAITMHLCGQFETLKLQLVNVGKEINLQGNHNQLSIVIKRHQHLMNLTTILEIAYHKIIFMQMLMSIGLIIVVGMNLLVCLSNRDLIGVFGAATMMQFMLFESYIYTHPADNLTSQADELKQALYSSQWYELPVHLMNDVVFMMMRIAVPPSLTAGKFFHITRKSYLDMIKTAASYLSVLRVMIE